MSPGSASAKWPSSRSHVRAHRGEAADLPHLARLWPELGPPPPTSDDAGLDATLQVEAIAQLLERAAAGCPLAVLLDDLQWADPPTLELLGYLEHRIELAPVLLLGTVRAEAIPGHDGLARL